MTNDKLLDAFRKRHCIESDYQLAQLLGVSVQVVSNFRNREPTRSKTITTRMLEFDLSKKNKPV